jgi:transposase
MRLRFKSALQNLLVSGCYAHRHEQRTGHRRALGSDRTSAAARTAQAQRRTAPGARSGRPGRHHLRAKERHTLGDAPQKEMGCGSGSTCWRRLRDWQEAGVWRELHRVLLDGLGESDRIEWGRASLDSASVPAKRGDRRPARIRRIREKRARSATLFRTGRASRSP